MSGTSTWLHQNNEQFEHSNVPAGPRIAVRADTAKGDMNFIGPATLKAENYLKTTEKALVCIHRRSCRIFRRSPWINNTAPSDASLFSGARLFECHLTESDEINRRYTYQLNSSVIPPSVGGVSKFLTCVVWTLRSSSNTSAVRDFEQGGFCQIVILGMSRPQWHESLDARW